MSEPANRHFPHLFAPLKIGSRTAKNRVMRVATTANLADGNRVGPRVLAFYKALAAGGVGTIVTEALRTQPHDPFGPGALVIFDRSAIDGLRQIADACHAAGALLIGQLNMGGRQHLASRVIPYAVAPSAIACPRSGGVPHELSAREIEDTIETYVSCAVHCIEAGMDGVEIHGAQGHLIQQFVSPYTNRRRDRWGGSVDNRLRFATEILRRTRSRIGRGIVGYRIGVEEFTAEGLGIDDTVEIARRFVEDGLIDYLSLSQGNFNSIETHLPDRHEPILAYRSLHARFKQVCDVPVVASTRVPGPEQAEAVIAAGEADMVGLCRPLIVDPQWPIKAQHGRSDEIRRCIACNQCWAWIGAGEPIACATNPEAGRAHLWPKLESDRAEFAREVLIVGAGPAGLEAARVAAIRGHRVTLLERDERAGGRLKRVHEVPYFEEMKNLLDYLVPQVQRGGTHIQYNTEASVEMIESAGADEIVIATGASALAPELPGDGSVPIISCDGPIEPSQLASGQTIVIMDEDGYYWTSMLIESAIALGKTPIVVTRFFEICRELPMVSRINLLRQLDRHQGLAIANSYVAGTRDGQVSVKHYLTGREQLYDDVAAVLWAGAAKANDELAVALIDAGASKDHVHLIGDAFSPRRLAQALGEAHALARRIGSAART